MGTMPNLDYTDLAATADVNNLRIELRGEIVELRGEMATLGGDLRSEMATNLRTMVLTKLGTSVPRAGFLAGFVQGPRTTRRHRGADPRTPSHTEARWLLLGR